MSNAPKTRVARDGLTELYRPSDDKTVEAHVIFIHGLFGSPEKTWTKDASRRAAEKEAGHNNSRHATFWPRELLPKFIPRATVYTWGYDADVDNFMQPASKNSVSQHARNLLNDLCDLRERYEDKTIPFIFIAHSLGGLIVKDALNRSSSEIGTRIKDIAPHTFAICFLGTPHRGSKLAKSGRRILAWTSLTSKQPNIKLIQALEQNSEILDRIGDSFLQTLDKYGFQLASFCEEKEIRLLLFINMFIVKPDSAKIGHSKEDTGTIPADHSNMVKFDSESDTGFSRVSKTIRRWVETAVSFRKDEDQDIMQSLKIEEAGVRYQQVVKNHDRTFGWLFDKNTVQFIDWLREAKKTGPNGRLFWITGKPGSGKSTIMKHAIQNPKTMDHLRASGVCEWHIIPFFFSDRGSEKQRAFQTMLQEILYQLLGRIGDSFSLVLPLYTRLSKVQKTKIPKWDLGTLREGISEVIAKSTSKAGICLFMDALDEHSGDNENLCKFFWDLSNKSQSSISLKICLASRPWPVFQKHFRGCKGFAIHDHTEKDIWNYVTSRLYDESDDSGLRRTATEDQTQEETGRGELAHDVTRNAQGVFIWVRLVIDELCQGLTDGTPIAMLKETLKNIPHELEDLYARALSKVRAEYAAEAHIIVHMVLSSLSPLRTQELLNCASWLLGHRIDPQRPEAQANRLASRTGGLLEVVNSNGSSVVQFIHQTAKEYIRNYGGRLRLKYMEKGFERSSEESKIVAPSSPLQPITGDEFSNMEGPEFFLLCGVRNPSVSASTVPHLFAYAKEVDNKLPQLAHNREALALDTLSRILDNESLWQSFLAYSSLKSFSAEPSHVELAVVANWENMIRKYYSYKGDFSKAAFLAATGPFIPDSCTDHVGMVKALIDGTQRQGQKWHDPFSLSETISPSPHPLLSKQLSKEIEASECMRLLSSVGADFHNIIHNSTLLTMLISIKSHPFVSEPERIEIAALLLKANLNLSDQGWIVIGRDGHSVWFRSALSFCLHFGSAGWVNMFLENTELFITSSPDEHESLTHCLASERGIAHPALRAAFLRKVWGKDEKKLRPIQGDEEGGLLGIGWPLAWFSSQCGSVGFPHINRGFCSLGDHRKDMDHSAGPFKT